MRIPDDPVNFVAQADEAALASALETAGRMVLRVDGAGVSDRGALFARCARDLAFPDGAVPRGWDGFTDYLRSAIIDRGAPRVAVVWSRADGMLDHGLADLTSAIEVFQSLARELYAARAGTNLPGPIDVGFFLLGDGANFPRLDG